MKTKKIPSKPAKPTKQQVELEISWLRQNKSKVPARTYFGDDNHEAIDAELEVLTEDMSEDEIYDRWGEEALGDDFDERILSMALDVRMWLDGEPEKESPSYGWSSLIK